jgi:hypothetical protein
VREQERMIRMRERDGKMQIQIIFDKDMRAFKLSLLFIFPTSVFFNASHASMVTSSYYFFHHDDRAKYLKFACFSLDDMFQPEKKIIK